MSHDIKTPVSAIKLYCAAVRKDLYNDKEKLHEIAGKIDNNANEIESYVSKIISASGDDFLDFSVNNSEFYLSEIINDLKKYYEDKLETSGTKFHIDKYNDIIIFGDKQRFMEVMQNVMENAIKYGDGREIEILFSDEEDARLITVSNTGCDLDENDSEHIFDSFYRGKNVGSKPGNGLGLYIAKKLMLRMQGDIFANVKDDNMNITLVCKKI